MNPLYLVTAFFWLMLIENNTGFPGVLMDLGGGLEVRSTLLLKVLFLVLSSYHIMKNTSGRRIPVYLLLFSFFLFCSTVYTVIVAPQHALKAFSVNLHIQLMLNIVVYIVFSTHQYDHLQAFYRSLRSFAVVNALLVIVSFVFPDLLSTFETYGGGGSAKRAFGLMGDEVSLFLTFFLFESLVFGRYKFFFLYFIAILCTAGIGAFMTSSVLIIYFLVFIKKVTVNTVLAGCIVLLLGIPGLIYFSGQLQQIGVVQRIMANVVKPKNENGNLRVISMTTAFDMIRQRPLLGYGYGNYGTMVYDKFAPVLKRAGYAWKIPSAMVILGSTFNPYLQMLAEAGVVGLLVFIWFLRRVLKNTPEIRQQSTPIFTNYSLAVRGWLVVFFFTCLSANWMLPASFLFLLIVSLMGINHAIRYSVQYV